MKRLFFSLLFVIAYCMSAMAQSSLVVTLQHGSNLQSFYGSDALSSAHTAAMDGDIITLSTGEFNGCGITKAVNIRGEGIGKTIINTNSSFTIPHECAYTLKFEGLEFVLGGDLSINGTDGTERAIFSKCLFRWGVNSSSLRIYNCNVAIIQCNFREGMFIYSDGNSIITCSNSKLGRLSRSGNSHFDIQNCVIFEGYDLKYCSIKNCIIDYTSSAWGIDATNTSSNCLVKNDCTGFTNSWYVDSWENIIKGNPISPAQKKGDLYQLTEDAAATYLGIDHTPVGIFGGTYPYDETPSYPLVTTLDVIGTYTNGKLNVKINVE